MEPGRRALAGVGPHIVHLPGAHTHPLSPAPESPQAFAVQYADTSQGSATAAAWLIVVSSIFQNLQGVFNHYFQVGDRMKARSLGWVFGAVRGATRDTRPHDHCRWRLQWADIGGSLTLCPHFK
jgi:hypothetical protein